MIDLVLETKARSGAHRGGGCDAAGWSHHAEVPHPDSAVLCVGDKVDTVAFRVDVSQPLCVASEHA